MEKKTVKLYIPRFFFFFRILLGKIKANVYKAGLDGGGKGPFLGRIKAKVWSVNVLTVKTGGSDGLRDTNGLPF